jgi:crotonobetainyl-CoA:carnitine CoA-transferase CaiB-like acyl-CoA transferase
LAPFGLFESKDGYVAICAANDRFFRRLPDAIGLPELLTDDRFARRAERASNADQIHAIIADWVRTRTTQQVVDQLARFEVPAAPVRTPIEAISDPHVRARHETTPLQHPVYGPVGAVVGSGIPIVFSKDPAELAGAAPLLGQHNAHVYGELLGFDQDRIAAMASDGLI